MLLNWLRKLVASATPEADKDGRWDWWDAKQHARFAALVVRDFKAQGRDVTVDDGAVQVDEHVFGLDNLAQYCRAIPEDEWQLAIEEHFGTMRRSEEEGAAWSAGCQNYEWAAPQLCLRVHGEDSMLPVDELAARSDMVGTNSNIVADLPSIAVGVRKETLEAWPVDLDSAIEHAIRRTLDEYEVELTWHDFEADAGLRIASLGADHLYAATHAYGIERFEELASEHGQLVSLPNRHMLLAYPIAAKTLLPAIDRMTWNTIQQHSAGPGSISTNLYWRRSARDFDVQRVIFDGEQVQFYPSEDFQDLLTKLCGEDADS